VAWPRLKKKYIYSCTPSLGLRGLFYGELLLFRWVILKVFLEKYVGGCGVRDFVNVGMYV
jgi:hypothetical protein